MLRCLVLKILPCLCFGTVCLWSAIPKAAKADTYGLVIGINEYTHLPSLEGAVADAEDIAQALGKLKPRQIVVLKNGAATKTRITAEWQRLIGIAKPGDTLILTYAGHGSQEPDQPPLDEQDGKDESFLLGAFDTNRKVPGYDERLVDDTFYKWFTVADKKGVRIIFVADACHSGTMVRSMRGPAKASVRAVPPYGEVGFLEPDTRPVEHPALIAEALPANVVFFSATQDDKKAPEVVIEGRMRGALSYAFARALEGAADHNSDGVLTQLELAPFIDRTVRQMSEAQQFPEVAYRSRDKPVPILTGLPKRPAFPSADTTPVPLKIINLGPDKIRELDYSGAIISRGNEPAKLVWDAKARTVFNDVGDPVAHDIDASDLQGVIDKWRILPVLKKMVLRAPLDISLYPSDERHTKGQVIEFVSAPVPYAHLIAFNLSADGVVQFLYPNRHSGDARQWTKGKRWRLSLKVVPPFGADHLVVIVSEKPLPDLMSRLRRAHAIELPKLLDEALLAVHHKIGLQGLYTSFGEE